MITLVISIFISLNAFAGSPGCEGEINPQVRALVNLTGEMIARKSLDPSDLDAMIDGEQIQNPYLKKPKSEFNLAFGRGLGRAIHEVRAHIPAAKEALKRFRDETLRDANRVDVAKTNTRQVISPQVLSVIPTSGDPKDRTEFWHRGPGGQLQLVVYYPAGYKLYIYSPHSTSPLIERALSTNLEFKSITSKDVYSLLSTRNGRLFVAGTSHRDGGRSVFVHDVANNKTFEQPIANGEGTSKLFETGDGQVYLAQSSKSFVSLYQVGNDLGPEKRLELEMNLSNDVEFLRGPNGRNAMLVQSMRRLQLIDLPSGKVLRNFNSQNTIFKSNAILIGKNDYAINVIQHHETRDENIKMSLTFLTSQFPRAIKVPFDYSRFNLGEWHKTKDGKVLFTVVQRGSPGFVLLFDPLNGPLETRWARLLPPWLESTVRPMRTFTLGDMDWASSPQWLKTHDEELFTVAYSRLSRGVPTTPSTYIQKIFSLNDPSDQEGKVVFQQDSIIYDFLLRQLGGQQFLIHSHPGDAKALQIQDVATGSSLATAVGEANIISSPLMTDSNGDQILTSSNPGWNSSIYIIRLVKGLP